MGRRLMTEIQAGFAKGGGLHQKLDNSNPFRSSVSANSIRLRSWAIHDCILCEAFTNVMMCKRVGISASSNTTQVCKWENISQLIHDTTYQSLPTARH